MVKNKRYDSYFKAVEGTHLSSSFKELVMSLLAFKPEERPTIPQIRKSAFLCENKKYSEERTRQTLLNDVQRLHAKKK